MSHVFIKLKDGTERSFVPKGRSGGSYTNTVRYEGAFAIVTDEWGDQTAFPAADIAEINTKPDRY